MKNAPIIQKIITIIQQLKDPETIYVLRGFNKWLCGADLPFLFGSEPNLSRLNIDQVTQEYNKQLITLGAVSEAKFIFYEDLLLLSSKNLGGLFGVYNKKLVVVNNDLYGRYHPSISDRQKVDFIQDQYEKDTDNLLQIYYGDVQEYNEQEYIAYNDIHDITTETINISELLGEEGFHVATDITKTIEFPEEYDQLIFADLVTQIIDQEISKVIVLKDILKSNAEVAELKKKFSQFGVEFVTKEYQQPGTEGAVDRTDEYLEILHRKNPDYGFREISIYENPYESNQLTTISQAVIIDDIVNNALLAQKQESFRDVFVTAPTGAGKSVMFQIPAIYLAEHHDLLTLVISPLIGLMKDQVSNIHSMTNCAATINSDYTPLEKEETLEAVRKGEKSILYLSPESLLSNSDITSLIGDRKIGLVVVDEAHIVTTWGKNFRPDYWYLGDFINKIRKNAKTDTNFPIATFTATATFGLEPDTMYRETIESLKMTPNKYIGNVRRDDISFQITPRNVENDYMSEKLKCATHSIESLIATGDKTLIYVPYKRHILQLQAELKSTDRIGIYHGEMQGGEKDETLRSIIDGDINAILATKAFGMGIDIDDIKYVYHFAPTGNIADYVQEIGRAARRPDMQGVAMTDFYKEDFRYINALYGMSSIRDSHIIGVLKQILETYYKEGKRNFMVSTDDFMWVFGESKTLDEVDRKLKTTLLMIKKDYEVDRDNNYAPIIFKPRGMFTFGYFMIEHDFVAQIEAAGLMRYFRKLDLDRTTKESASREVDSEVRVTSMGDTYQVNFKRLWENRYRDMSFGSFKYNFMTNGLKDFNYRVGDKIHNRIIIEIEAKKSLGEVFARLETFLLALNEIFDEYRRQYKFFKPDDFAKVMLDRGVVKKKYIADMIAKSIIHLLLKVETHSLVEASFAIFNHSTEMWRIENTGYEKRTYLLQKAARQFLFGDGNKTTQYVNYRSGEEAKKTPTKVLVAQLISMLELANCDITSGSHPEFFIRVNNPYAISRVVSNPNYHSYMVGAVAKKHQESQILMKYFFTKIQDDETRWDFIEKYFLSQLNVNDYKDDEEAE